MLSSQGPSAAVVVVFDNLISQIEYKILRIGWYLVYNTMVFCINNWSCIFLWFVVCFAVWCVVCGVLLGWWMVCSSKQKNLTHHTQTEIKNDNEMNAMKKIKRCLLILLISLIVTYIVLMTKTMMLFYRDDVIVTKKSTMQHHQGEFGRDAYADTVQIGTSVRSHYIMDSNHGQIHKGIGNSHDIEWNNGKDVAHAQNIAEENNTRAQVVGIKVGGEENEHNQSHHNYLQQQQQQRQLQFLHIPKNAGSAVTDAAIRGNIVS